MIYVTEWHFSKTIQLFDFQTIRFDTDPPNGSKQRLEVDHHQRVEGDHPLERVEDHLDFPEEDSLYCRYDCDSVGSNPTFSKNMKNIKYSR